MDRAELVAWADKMRRDCEARAEVVAASEKQLEEARYFADIVALLEADARAIAEAKADTIEWLANQMQANKSTFVSMTALYDLAAQLRKEAADDNS